MISYGVLAKICFKIVYFLLAVHLCVETYISALFNVLELRWYHLWLPQSSNFPCVMPKNLMWVATAKGSNECHGCSFQCRVRYIWTGVKYSVELPCIYQNDKDWRRLKYKKRKSYHISLQYPFIIEIIQITTFAHNFMSNTCSSRSV